VIGAVWRHTKRKSSKFSPAGKVSPTINNDYTPVNISETVPTDIKDEITTFQPATKVLLFTIGITPIYPCLFIEISSSTDN